MRDDNNNNNNNIIIITIIRHVILYLLCLNHHIPTSTGDLLDSTTTTTTNNLRQRKHLKVYLRCIGNKGLSIFQLRPNIPCRDEDNPSSASAPSRLIPSRPALPPRRSTPDRQSYAPTPNGGEDPTPTPTELPNDDDDDDDDDDFDFAMKLIGQTIQGTQVLEGFGYSVSLSSQGRTLAIGAIGHDDEESSGDDEGVDVGLARIFRYDDDDDEWRMVGEDLLGMVSGEEFGAGVSLSSEGEGLAVGGKERSWMFDYKGGSEWELVQTFSNTIDPRLSHDATRMVTFNMMQGITPLQRNSNININWQPIGDPFDSGLYATLSGTGNRIIAMTRSGIMITYRMDPSTDIFKAIGDNVPLLNGGEVSAAALALSGPGHVAAVSIDGVVRIYRYVSREWALQVTIPGESSDDGGFGFSLALSSDGNRIIIGSPLYGGNKGRVVIYQNARNREWEKIVADEVGSAAMSFLGFSVSMSPEGKYVAIGAPYDGSQRSGAVNAYKLVWNGGTEKFNNRLQETRKKKQHAEKKKVDFDVVTTIRDKITNDIAKNVNKNDDMDKFKRRSSKDDEFSDEEIDATATSGSASVDDMSRIVATTIIQNVKKSKVNDDRGRRRIRESN